MGFNRHLLLENCYGFFFLVFVIGVLWVIWVTDLSKPDDAIKDDTSSKTPIHKTFHPGYMLLISGVGGGLLTFIINKSITKFISVKQSKLQPAETTAALI